MAKKTRISGIVDNSTMGVNLGTEMVISRETNTNIRRAMSKAAQHGLKQYPGVIIEHKSGDPLKGNALFLLRFNKRNKEESSIQYEFKQQGKNYFLNVTGNPTSVIVGSNDIPVLIMGFDYEGLNRPTITFKYLNRVLYAVMDTLLAEHGFSWSGADKKRLVDGDISIQRYQLAWYSKDLGDQRDAVYRFLRAVFGGLDATSERVINVTKELGLTARLWGDNNMNLTIEARSSDKKSFSLTFYAKEQEPGYEGDAERLCSLIRWDCTLNNVFLTNNRMRTVKELEDRYVEICSEKGFDIGFIRFISEKVEKRLKLPYLLSLHLSGYRKSLKALENIEGKNHKKVAKHWLEYGPRFSEDAEAAKFFEMQPSNYSSIKADFLRLGIDLGFPRATHEAILENRILAHRTIEERGFAVTSKPGSNRVIPWQTLVDRDEESLNELNTVLDNANGMLKVRKFTPVKIKPDNFWIYRKAE